MKAITASIKEKIKNLPIKERIAIQYVAFTSLLLIILFLVIYYAVKFYALDAVNRDLFSEAKKHLNEIKIEDNQIKLIYESEWKEREHNHLDINPVFIAFYDDSGQIVETSPNLKKHILSYKSTKETIIEDSKILQKDIRQLQMPIVENSEIKGYMVVAMSTDSIYQLLLKLKFILWLLFPISLVLSYIIALIIAENSVKPLHEIIKTSNDIKNNNLSKRIELPNNQDELHQLAITLNELMDSIEHTLNREKQFTSDASHELRTPLAVIKGTLEVLIRKPRETSEYKSKIKEVIQEIEKINHLLEQLLHLARHENIQYISKEKQTIYLNDLLFEAIEKTKADFKSQDLIIHVEANEKNSVLTHPELAKLIISNILANAVKYSSENKKIDVSIVKEHENTLLKITDYGMGIKAEDLSKIFQPFYRLNPDGSTFGYGIGLTLSKKIAQILNIDLNVTSQVGEGTTVVLKFK